MQEFIYAINFSLVDELSDRLPDKIYAGKTCLCINGDLNLAGLQL